MTLEEKKLHILRLIPLGVDFFSACIDARCTTEEIGLLEEDDELQGEIEYSRNQEKIRLLESYIMTAKASAHAKLDTNGVRNVIKDLFPEAFGEDVDKDPVIRKITVRGVYPESE